MVDQKALIMNSTRQNLLLLCLNEQDIFQTKSTIGFKCDCSFLNWVIIGNNFDHADLVYARKHYKNNPNCTLWIDAQNITAKNSLSCDAFTRSESLSEMTLDLKNLPSISCNSHIKIRRVTSDHEILATWVPLVDRCYCPELNLSDIEKNSCDWNTFFNYLRTSTAYSQMNFFLGYWNEIPVSTGLFIVKDDAVYVYLIGTLSEYRQKGLGMAITNQPLNYFKENGIKKAFLFATTRGKSIYEKIGFTTIGQVDIYKAKTEGR